MYLNPSNLPNLPSLVDSLSNYMIATNMSTSDMVSLGLAVKNIDPSKQIHYQQLQGAGQKLYDNILKAKNDQIVIMKNVISQYFSS
jgi:archaellum component FlaF (FlaF/FlaG flagellin family)